MYEAVLRLSRLRTRGSLRRARCARTRLGKQRLQRLAVRQVHHRAVAAGHVHDIVVTHVRLRKARDDTCGRCDSALGGSRMHALRSSHLLQRHRLLHLRLRHVWRRATTGEHRQRAQRAANARRARAHRLTAARPRLWSLPRLAATADLPWRIIMSADDQVARAAALRTRARPCARSRLALQVMALPPGVATSTV